MKSKGNVDQSGYGKWNAGVGTDGAKVALQWSGQRLPPREPEKHRDPKRGDGQSGLRQPQRDSSLQPSPLLQGVEIGIAQRDSQADHLTTQFAPSLAGLPRDAFVQAVAESGRGIFGRETGHRFPGFVLYLDFHPAGGTRRIVQPQVLARVAEG